MKKKILSLVLALCMCLTLLPAQAFAAAAGGECTHQPSDGSNTCKHCSQPILAKVTRTGSSDTLYYLAVAEAVNKAAELSATSDNETVTVTLLDAAQWGSGNVTAPAGTYTIDLNGKNLDIGGNNAGNYMTLTIQQGAHVTIKCSGETGYQQGLINCSGVTVNAGGSLTLEHVSTYTAPVTVSGTLTFGTYGASSGTVTVSSGGTVTLNGSMTSITTLTANSGSTVNLWQGYVTNLNVAGGTVTIGQDTATSSGLVNISGAVSVTGGKLTVNRGEFNSGSSITISDGTVNLNGKGSTDIIGTLNVTGGTLNCGTVGNNLNVTGNVAISGGTVTISKGAFTNNSAADPNTMTISGGTVTIGGGSFKNVTVTGGKLDVKQTVTVFGTGSEAMTITNTPQFGGDVTISGGEVEISAGTFSETLETTETYSNIATCLATGSRVKKAGSYMSRDDLSSSMEDFTVESCTGHAVKNTLKCDYCDTDIVAKVTTQGTVKYYATFSDAVEGSKEGDTITLLQNVTLTGNAVSISGSRTLDLNGKTLTGNVTLEANTERSVAPTVTGNGTVTGTVTIADNAPAKLMNGTFKAITGSNLGSLLPDRYGFQTTNLWYDKNSTYSGTLNDVTVKLLPIQSVTIHNQTITANYGTSVTAKIDSVAVADGYSTDNVSYRWYRKNGETWNEISGATSSTYSLGGTDTGCTLKCAITLDGYTVERQFTVTIGPADQTAGTHFTAPTPKTNLTYNGEDQCLIDAAAIISGNMSGTIKYKIGVSGAEITDAAYVVGKDAKTYTVYYTITPDTSYSSKYTTYNGYVNVTIEPKTVTAAVSIVGSSFTYTGSAIEPAVTVKDGETVIPVTEYTVSYSNNTAAGTATVTVTDRTGGNYTVSGTTTFTIGKAASSVVTAPAANTLTYTGAEQELVTAGTAANGTMEYSLDGETYSESVPTTTDAGTYTVYYKVTGDTNYTNIAPATVSVTIDPKPVTADVSVVGSSFTYTGSAIEPAVTVKDGETVIPTGEYTVSYSNNTLPGTATVTVTDKTGGNYTVSGTTTFTIGTAASSVVTAPTANTLTYTGAEQELVTAGTAANGTMEYSLDGVTYSESIPTATEAGTYTVYYRVVGNTNYTDVAPATVSVTIANRTVSPGIIPIIPNIPTVKTVTGEDGTALRITTTTLPDGTVEESWEIRIPEGKAAVTVPGTITVGGAGNTSHAIDIIMPEGAGETDVEFRVPDATSGTVVLLVHEDGTEEVLSDTVQTESGVRITVRGNMRVKIGNRSVTFSDTVGHWSEDDVNYVAARGLFVGIGNGKFGVGLEATRGTVLTVLARLAGVDTNGGATWYEKGVQWAMENGISDGTNPNDSITREQLAAILYRFILLQGGRYEGELNIIRRYSDAQQASDWACEALCWCTEHGILQGRTDGSLDPKGTATREEIAAMLARFLRLGAV